MDNSTAITRPGDPARNGGQVRRPYDGQTHPVRQPGLPEKAGPASPYPEERGRYPGYTGAVPSLTIFCHCSPEDSRTIPSSSECATKGSRSSSDAATSFTPVSAEGAVPTGVEPSTWT